MSSSEGSKPTRGQTVEAMAEAHEEEMSRKRITTRSMTVREREDELGPEATKHREAIIEVLQKAQQFMDIGDIASHAVCGGLVRGPVVTVEGIFGKIIAMEIARGRSGMLKRSLDGGYGLKEWVDEADDSQSTIPDNEMDTGTTKPNKTNPAPPKSRGYHVLEGHPWQQGVTHPRYARIISPWTAAGGMVHPKQSWMQGKNFGPPKDNGMGCWGRGYNGCHPSRPLWNGTAETNGMPCGHRKAPNIMNIPLPDFEASHGVMGEECPIHVQLASFDEKDKQFEQSCMAGMAQGPGGMGMEASNWYPSNWSSSDHGNMVAPPKNPWAAACQNNMYYPGMPSFGNNVQIKEEPVGVVARSGNGC
ncbi:hypothetical protein BSKO_06528 [Bryopsis sp. KO-2023]|nr:hypothetical protein BSKO_06528 [Bryopsis sp. KO-2023]